MFVNQFNCYIIATALSHIQNVYYELIIINEWIYQFIAIIMPTLQNILSI